MSDYVPIACVEHERLEFAVLCRQRLCLEYRDEAGQTISIIVLPTDVENRDGA
jgi:Rho-binding antiterminator